MQVPIQVRMSPAGGCIRAAHCELHRTARSGEKRPGAEASLALTATALTHCIGDNVMWGDEKSTSSWSIDVPQKVPSSERPNASAIRALRVSAVTDTGGPSAPATIRIPATPSDCEDLVRPVCLRGIRGAREASRKSARWRAEQRCLFIRSKPEGRNGASF